MSTALTTVISQSRTQIADVLPPGHDVDRVIRLVRLAIHKNPSIAKCDPVTVIEAIMAAAQLGLEIGRLAHLVPFKGRCQMVPDYKGLIDLAQRSESVMTVQSYVVYADDLFSVVQGTSGGITHVPDLGSDARGDGDIAAVYAVAQIAKGGATAAIHEVMTLQEVLMIRDRSRAKSSGPWVTDFAAMARKTVVKRLCKMLPQTPALGIAIEYDNRHETGEAGSSFVPGDTEQGIAAGLAAKASAARQRMAETIEAEVVDEDSN